MQKSNGSLKDFSASLKGRNDDFGALVDKNSGKQILGSDYERYQKIINEIIATADSLLPPGTEENIFSLPLEEALSYIEEAKATYFSMHSEEEISFFEECYAKIKMSVSPKAKKNLSEMINSGVVPQMVKNPDREFGED